MLTTNGVFNKKILESIKQAKDYILGVQISLDGSDWESHGYLRKDINGKSNINIFKTTLFSIKEIIKCGIRTSIATCIHQNNINKLNDLKSLIISLHPNNWSLSTISISGRAKESEELFVSESKLSNEYWHNLKEECEKNKISVSFVDMPNLVKENPNAKIYYECPASKWFCEINSDGLTTPCPLARVNPPKEGIEWDNIKEKDIEDIWNGKPFTTFRKYQNIGCDGCNAKDKCDRCPPQSVQWFSDPLMPTPYCVSNGEKLCLKNLKELTKKLEQAKKKHNREDYGIKEEV